MSDKKLLEYFKSDDIHLIQCEHKWCNAYGYEKSQMKKDILNYITNLQQENEDLKNRLENAVADCNLRLQENERLKEELNYTVSQVQHNQIVTKLCKEKDDYKSKCEKTIEYIENNKKETSSHFNGKEYVYRNFTLCCEPNDLLNILNGVDKNVDIHDV
jgi:hypothetical protein